MNNVPQPAGRAARTLQQRRAADAWAKTTAVRDDKGLSVEQKREYGQLIRGLSAMIRHDGLGPSLAFLRAKNKPHHQRAYQHLSDWVLGEHARIRSQNDHRDSLLEWSFQDATSERYRWATTEALTYLVWLKRFVEALELTE